jgi:tellurite resistance protein
MLQDDKINLLARVARTPSGPPSARSNQSILLLAALSYGSRPDDEATVPTGFDPSAARLFEAILEGAYLVASADGVVDAAERDAFERVVAAACGGIIDDVQIRDLITDFGDQLTEDGVDGRVAAIGKSVNKPSHAMEVLRIAALLAQTSEDVSDVERTVLTKLAAAVGLDAGAVDKALADVDAALSTTS